MTLKPEFSDHRVCRKCGAPAALIGEPWLRDGVWDFWRKPIEAPVREGESCKGTVTRTRKVSSGRGVEVREYQVRVLTHICTRSMCRDKDGNPADGDLFYACGCLTTDSTMSVRPDELPPECHIQGDEPW